MYNTFPALTKDTQENYMCFNLLWCICDSFDMQHIVCEEHMSLKITEQVYSQRLCEAVFRHSDALR